MTVNTHVLERIRMRSMLSGLNPDTMLARISAINSIPRGDVGLILGQDAEGLYFVLVIRDGEAKTVLRTRELVESRVRVDRFRRA